MRGRSARRAALGLAVGLVLACGAEAPRADFPGMPLLARVEARLEGEKPVFRAQLAHYGLLYPVEASELAAFMAQIRVHGAGPDLALGTEFDPESHGGGLLRLLFDHWQPDGRKPRLADRYPFAGGDVALEEFYRAYQQQIVLPETGLPRLHFRFGLPGGLSRDVERDAYKLLGLLIALEPERSAHWMNRSGQTLSLDLLLQRVRAHYLASGAPSLDPPDHSELHLVELLVAAGGELEAVQQHFLAAELAQRTFEPRDTAFLVSHFVESLGHLLGAEALAWDEPDAARVKGWLAALEPEHFRDVAAADLESLSHLAAGLRAVRAQQAKLD